ncbi:hypothetical protein VC83_08946 [Pseudogymnoascus destructans]|uniref:Granulins domain-containing protein n=2 Tax=Pseudogymnoascus destructans TaxID=655981 RepID=L8FNT8_PSED2|nr:uncharacterized protein VC83_08946 [Pseudogymnoascus destructans]ELR02567.1 hypothetical protein GMDG_01092 [Pseudogymnoascus destructans 20631-21]OAF54698.1 hypothetical protein VC83_08946 [Pseudogymnoascus destructans]
MRSLRLIGAAALLILQVARCNSDTRPANVVAQDHGRGIASSAGIAARDNALEPGKAVMKESNRFNQSTISAVALGGRALIAEWLNPVALERRACTGTYKASCGDGYCCPTTDRCCSNNAYCKKSAGDDCCSDGTCPYPYVCGDTCECKSAGGVCCPDGTNCKAGDKCCGDSCTDAANICCSDGTACSPGNICVANKKYGWDECCTNSACTAYVKSGVTITRTSDTPTSATAAPRTTDVYQYFYTTLYFSYYYYFYTYRYDIEVTTLTSTYTTTTTTLSVYAANSRTAASQLSSMSSSVEENDFTTPERATTALNSSPARTTSGASATDFQDDGTNQNGRPVVPGIGVGGPGLGMGVLPGAGTQVGIVLAWAVAWALGAAVVAWGMVWL